MKKEENSKMKDKTTKLLSFLLPFVMLLGMLPTTVFAGNTSPLELKSITITGVPMPQAGDKVRDYNHKKPASVSITTNPTGAVSGYDIDWYNDEGNNITTETFVAGTTYSYRVAVKMADGYCCTNPTGINAKLNGKKPDDIFPFGSAWNGQTYNSFGMVNNYTIPVAYTMSFDMNGHGRQVDAQKVNEGAKATKPADPTAEGYNFKGWYADENLTNEFDFETAIRADTTVYAKWEKKADNPANPSNPTKPAKTNPTTGTESPKTGDNSNMALWIALLFVSGIGVFGTTVYSKKKKSIR